MGQPLSIPLVGAATDRRTQTPEFTIGVATIDNQNRTWVYVVADVTVTAAQAPVLSGTFHLTAATGGSYTADVGFAIGDYGWVRKTTSPL